jgi:hypothetical protein
MLIGEVYVMEFAKFLQIYWKGNRILRRGCVLQKIEHILYIFLQQILFILKNICKDILIASNKENLKIETQCVFLVTAYFGNCFCFAESNYVDTVPATT